MSPHAPSAFAQSEGLWEREKLTGEWGGLRTDLAEKGVEIDLTYIGETLGNLSGGLRRGAVYQGRLDLSLNADLDKLVGWNGGTFHVRAFQIHNGGDLAAALTGSVADPSNIAATPSTRLYTAWLQHDIGKLFSLRIGQLAADDEFIVSGTAGALINGTFGWPAFMAANLPSGGPAYPLATPGVRLQVNPTENLSLLAALFSGDPAGSNCTVPAQLCNRDGTNFSFSGGAFWMGEAQYQVNQEKDAKGLAAAYKIGAWLHTGNFADQRFGIDATGTVASLAAAPGTPLLQRDNWGVYGVIDQMFWRADDGRSASFFLRGGLSPSDRNLVSWYVDGGVGFTGLIPGRGDDTLTLGFAYSRIGDGAVGLDRDTLAIGGPPYPIRHAEAVLELTYVAQLAPWWTVQPDIQYIIRPGGNVPDPNDPAATVGNAFVIGLRSTLRF